ncbi:MAG: D-alanyl-D-alanine carboxypeptidase/D-alanyl-D-alanine endopeptidase [Kineosporiaceae bacterium]
MQQAPLEESAAREQSPTPPGADPDTTAPDDDQTVPDDDHTADAHHDPGPDVEASMIRSTGASSRRRRWRPPRLALGPIGRRTAALCVLLVATVLAAAAGTGAVVLSQSSTRASGASETSPAPTTQVRAAPGATVPPPPPAVLPSPAASALVPSPSGLQRLLGPLLRTPGLGGSISAEIVDLASGASLLAISPTTPAVPASSAKLLTGAAALSLLGPSARLSTTVVDGPGKDEISLVGGGDVTLAAGHGAPGGAVGRAGIADLAGQTAAALHAQGRHAVAVRLDDTLFKGPAVNPAWSAGDVRGGFVAPVTALAVNSGSAAPAVPLVPGAPAARVADPSMAAAQLFAAALERDGIAVTGPVVRAKAPDGAAELARVESATVGDLVEHALTDSDNTVAEALARVVAVKAGRQGTFADAGVAVLDRVDLLGVPAAGAHLSGGSGLGGGNGVSARVLARLLVLAAAPEHPELRPLLTGLPVAGASGTLADRFGTARERAGLGVVRAKTGTLTGVSSLAGTVVDADGRQLGFVLLADRVTSTLAARTALDDAASTLAACGCR